MIERARLVELGGSNILNDLLNHYTGSQGTEPQFPTHFYVTIRYIGDGTEIDYSTDSAGRNVFLTMDWSEVGYSVILALFRAVGTPIES